MPTVLDANLAIRMLLPNRDRDRLRQAIIEHRESEEVFVAPSQWRYEVTSALVKTAYFGEVTEEIARSALHYAITFPIHLVMPNPQLTEATFVWSLQLGRANAYDAFYLALAEALGCELWTLDHRLVNAAGKGWVRSPIA